MALRRCADIGPKSFKIVERHHVLKCGLSEDNKKVKQVFTENLLVKWLNAYNRNVVEFLKVLKLDADENDVITTEEICKDIMNLILRFVFKCNTTLVLVILFKHTVSFPMCTCKELDLGFFISQCSIMHLANFTIQLMKMFLKSVTILTQSSLVTLHFQMKEIVNFKRILSSVVSL